MDYQLYDGANLLMEIFIKNLGSFGLIIGVLFLFIFAFSSLIGQYYLGESNALLFTKFLKIEPKKMIIIYRIIFIIGLILGIILNMNETINLVDIGLLILGFTNMIVLIKLEKRSKKI